MTDNEIIEKMAIAMRKEAEGEMEVADSEWLCRAALAVARPIIRDQALEEAAKHLRDIAAAMFEKAESIRSGKTPFALATVEEKDAAVMAGDFEKAAEAIRALKDKIND